MSAISPIVVSVANRFAEYEASDSTAWDSTMDVRNRPEWCKQAENKTFAPKAVRRFSQVLHPPLSQIEENEDTLGGDNPEAAIIDMSASASLSAWEWEEEVKNVGMLQPLPPPPDGGLELMQLEQLEQLKHRQRAQMQTLLERNSQIAEQQLVAQIEIERLQAQQQEQLSHTELVLEQQRSYLDEKQQAHTELGGSGCVQCADTSFGNHGSTSPGTSPEATNVFSSGCFSAEI